MEKNKCPTSTVKEGLHSCWGCLKLKLPWTRQRDQRRGVGKVGGGYRYDPLSYAQNFDEGWDDDEELSQRGFSARYAAPSSKFQGDK